MSSNSYYQNKIPLERLSQTQNLIPKKDRYDHFTQEQQQSTLKEQINKNINLHFNSPNYVGFNPINYEKQPEASQYKPHTKTTQFSNIDHLAGYPEPQQKRVAKNGEFQHLAFTSPDKQWKPQKKNIEQKPREQKPDRIHTKKTDYTDKYARNVLFQGDETVLKQKNQENVAVRQSAGNQVVSTQTQRINAQRNGFDGERKKKQFHNNFFPSQQQTLNLHSNIQVQNRNQDFYQSTEVQAATQHNPSQGQQNLPGKQLNLDIYKSDGVQAGTQLNQQQQQQQQQQTQKTNQQQNNMQKSSEVWPLRSDIPSKKHAKNPFEESNQLKRDNVFSAMHCEYGMPNAKQFTEKVNNHQQLNSNFSNNNTVDYRRKYNVIQKEEKLATQSTLNYSKFY